MTLFTAVAVAHVAVVVVVAASATPHATGSGAPAARRPSVGMAPKTQTAPRTRAPRRSVRMNFHMKILDFTELNKSSKTRKEKRRCFTSASTA